MDQDPREADASLDRERTPEEIQAEIEAARHELGDTVAAVAEKVDIKRQARQQMDGARQVIQARREQIIGRARAGSPESAGAGMQQVAATARDNPLPLAVGGALVLGFLLGRRRASR
jgi:CHASE3 domain sensor protein